MIVFPSGITITMGLRLICTETFFYFHPAVKGSNPAKLQWTRAHLRTWVWIRSTLKSPMWVLVVTIMGYEWHYSQNKCNSNESLKRIKYELNSQSLFIFLVATKTEETLVLTLCSLKFQVPQAAQPRPIFPTTNKAPPDINTVQWQC